MKGGLKCPQSMRIGDLVVSSAGHWHMPKLVVRVHPTARNLVGVLFGAETKYIHYQHLEVVSESRRPG